MPNIKFVLEYDGGGFHGWQHQPGLRTIQSELRRVLQTVLREPLGELIAAGRTDSGVHARGQVVNFHTAGEPDLAALMNSVNAIFRGEISVLSAEVVPDSFHATVQAVRKRYVYTIFNRPAPPTLERFRVWHIRYPLNLERMREQAAALLGEHDFKSFQGQKCQAKTTVRRILVSEILEEPPFVRYAVEAEGFIKQMVRNIAGTLVAYGTGREKYPSILDVIAAQDRRAAGMTAPGRGLCMEWVRYE